MADKNKTEGFIATKQAAKLTGYTNDYIGQLARSGHLETFKEGRERYVKVVDLFNYISAKNNNNKEIEPAEPLIVESSDENSIHHNTVDEESVDNNQESTTISPWIKYQAEPHAALHPQLDKTTLRSKAVAKPQLPSRKPRFTKTIYHESLDSSTKQVGPKLQLLPALSAITVTLAMAALMFSAGFGAIDIDKQISATSGDYNYAAVAQSSFLEFVALGWYELVNDLLDLDN